MGNTYCKLFGMEINYVNNDMTYITDIQDLHAWDLTFEV